MSQRGRLQWFCLLACIFCYHRVSGQLSTEQASRKFFPGQLTSNSFISDDRPGLLTFHENDTLGLLSFVPATDFHRGRFWLATGMTTALYTGTVIALNEAWYTQYPRSSFHFFDDAREWRYMDKMGHLYTSYFESLWAYKVARWTGMEENACIATGTALGLIFQGTVEVLDGFSEEWGFSLADAGFNVIGSGAFFAQQKWWGEQRIVFKVSSTPIDHPSVDIVSVDGNAMTTLDARTEELFGRSYAERFLKDYNAQTNWVSINIHSFLHEESAFPRWLNIAIGYGAENMYGGFENSWKDGEAKYVLDKSAFPRYSQWYISPDIDFTKIKCRSPFGRTLLGMLNVFKIPGPVLEMSEEEGVKVKVRW